MSTDHTAHVRRYVADADEKQIASIVKYCGIALRNRDSSFVACSDKEELGRVRDGFAKKKLGLTDDTRIDAAMAAVCATMKAERDKPRVTFYYLLAKETGTLAKLA
jgi:Protein of unknown function (DUF2853)